MKSPIIFKSLLIIFIASIFLFSCQSEQSRSYKRIANLQDSLYNGATGMVNLDVAGKLLEESMKYATTYPDDTASAVMLLKAKDYALYVNDPVRSIQIMQKFIDTYPDHSAFGSVLFTMGFVYENYLGELAKARDLYERFLQAYPNEGKLSEDARFALDNLGKSAEEIVMGFGTVAADTSVVVDGPAGK